MPTEIPGFAEVYAAVLFLAGIACLGHFIFLFKGSKRIEPHREIAGWNLGFADFFMGLGIIFFAILLLQTIIANLAPAEPGMDGRAWHIVFAGLAMHLTALGAVFAFYKHLPEKFEQPMNSRDIGWGRSLLIALYGYLAVIPVIYPLTYGWQRLLEVFGIEAMQQETVLIFSQVEHPLLLALIIFLTIAIAPVSEEILFRGCLYRFIKAKSHILFAILLSGLLFAILHQNLLVFLPLLILGVVLAYAYEKSGTIKVPILIHGIFNLNTVIVIVLTGNAG